MPLSGACLALPLPGAAVLAPRAPDTCRRARTVRRTSP